MPRDFTSLYRDTVAPLRRYLARMLGCHSEAQDVAQDAYVRVLKVMDERELEHPKPFLFTTARRLALNRLRRTRLGTVQSAEDNVIALSPCTRPSVEELVMARQEWEQVESAIANLPPGCREVLRLNKIEQLTHREIAKRLGIAVSTVEKQHARALRLLDEALENLRLDTVEPEELRRAGLRKSR